MYDHRYPVSVKIDHETLSPQMHDAKYPVSVNQSYNHASLTKYGVAGSRIAWGAHSLQYCNISVWDYLTNLDDACELGDRSMYNVFPNLLHVEKRDQTTAGE